ncbi:MAG: hypothetical protein M3O50_11095 [Myxococcota bacterium]|nr:hypothetical protein [Myxococcota bacterium]
MALVLEQVILAIRSDGKHLKPGCSRAFLVFAGAPGALVAIVGTAACDDLRAWRDDHATTGAGATALASAAPLASVARLLGLDAGDLEPAIDPPALPGELESEIRRFTSVDECAKQHAGIDPLVGDALEAIGYDTFVRDACRVLNAAKAKDTRPCDAIDASSLRAHCRATVAEVLGTPNACPWATPDHPARGRDPFCVAIASHDVRLCAGLGTAAGRASCEAIGGPSDSPCAELRSRVEEERCARGAHRWRSALAPVASSPGPLPALALGAGELRLESNDAGPLAVDLGPDLAHGVVVVEQRDGLRFVVGPLSQGGPGFIAPAPHESASLAVELFLRRASSFGPAPARGGDSPPSNAAIVERVELLLPGHAPLATPSVHASLVAIVDELEPSRGATLRFRLDGWLENAGGHFDVHVRGATFVRDVVKAGAVYAIEAIEPTALGGDGGMR